MRYLGGKGRIARRLVDHINQVRKPGQEVWDAFCGGLWMSVALSANGPVVASDACAPLINLYRAVRNGWEPPTEVSRETYRAARYLPDIDPMKAFCGFGCSFGGKWFGGYAAGFNGPLTYPQLAARNVKCHAPIPVHIEHVNMLHVAPGPCEGVAYFDPPYRGTTAYAGVAPFDSDKFEALAFEWSRFCPVFVSEYAFPRGKVIWERQAKTTLARHVNQSATEKLFYLAKGS